MDRVAAERRAPESRATQTLDSAQRLDRELLTQLAADFHVAEIDVIGTDGVIALCTNPEYEGFDMRSGEQSRAFLGLLDGETEFVQDYQPIARDETISRKYAGVALARGGFVQVGLDAIQFQQDIDEIVVGATRNRHVGEGGFIIISDKRWLIVSDSQGYENQSIYVTGLWRTLQKMPEGERFAVEVYGQDCYCMYRRAEGYFIIAAIPRSEAVFSRNVSVYIMIYMEVLIYSALFAVVYFLVKLRIVNQIHSINGTLSRITGGDLDVTVNVRSNEEFASLSDDINSTVDTLKRYIADAAARIDEELAFAKQIQHSALPSEFPQRPEIDVWAGMRTAKEVGGDFYDVYLIGEDRLAFLVADVSGKGIPAALFMMTSKALIKSLAEGGAEADEAFTRANQELCEHNEEGMFVTAWMGVLDLKTGLVRFANAGHNPPLVRRGDGEFEYLKSRAGFVLAGMEGIHYRINELQLMPGDAIYLYTDGVTEATDANAQLYGEQRLRDFLNGKPAEGAEALCRAVLGDVDAFVGEAAQFDDITMLCLRYRGAEKGEERMAREISVDARVENIAVVTDFVDELLDAADCPMRAKMQLDIAIDELFSNIAHYAYGPEGGEVTVRAEVSPGGAALTFIDRGMPFDPTEQREPDLTLPAEQREIGGLGILMVKKSMDGLSYERADGENRLRVVKKW